MFNKKIHAKVSSTNKERVLKVQEVFVEWSARMNLNCYAKIFVYKENSFVKLIWISILLASSVTTFWLIANSILDYTSFKVVSRIAIEYEYESQFIAITICDNKLVSTVEPQKLFEEIAFNNKLNFNNKFLLNCDYIWFVKNVS